MTKKDELLIVGSAYWCIIVFFVFALGAVAVVAFVSCSHIIWEAIVLNQDVSTWIYIIDIISVVYLIAFAVIYPKK